MKHICIIPARGGSKRIPRKNIKLFLGRPIIAYSIEAALASGLFDEVMVSTDDDEIASVARKYGASVPFLRSERTANDFATTADVIEEVLENYAKNGAKFDVVTCLYATAPFIKAKLLRDSFDTFTNGNYDSAFTCVEFSYPVHRSLIINKDRCIEMKWPEYKNSRSQDLPNFYHDAGQLYMAYVSTFREVRSMWGERACPIILSELIVQDLDTTTDWALAEMKYKLQR